MHITRRFLSGVRRLGHSNLAVSAYPRRILVLSAAVVVATVTVTAPPASAGARVRSLDSKASGTEVVDGCTVVLQPTSTRFTRCRGKNLARANFSGLDLQFANFSKSNFVPNCGGQPGGAFCAGADFDHANLAHANVKNAVFASCCGTAFSPAEASATLTGANMQQIDAAGATFGDLTGLDLRYANLIGVQMIIGGFNRADLTGANLSKVLMEGVTGDDGFAHAVLIATNFTDAYVGGLSFTGATLSGQTNFSGSEIQYSDFTGTKLVPLNRTVPATSPSGAVVTWGEAKALSGASPGKCTPASGSSFAVGATTVRCTINGGPGLPNWGGPNVASGTFVVTVQ
jgi:uncharacterized protein YjbI with pentapeptide repeats